MRSVCRSVTFASAALAAALTLLAAVPAGAWTLRWQHREVGMNCKGATHAPGGGLYVVGYVQLPGMTNAFLRRYSPDGQVLWTVQVPNGTAWAAAVAQDGSVYVVGEVFRQSMDIWWARYTSDGKLLASWTLDSASHGYDTGRAIAIDGNGDLYLAGTLHRGRRMGDMWVSKRGPDGQERWSRTFDGWRHGNDGIDELAVAPDGSVYAVGHEGRFDLPTALVIRKLSRDGVVLWKRNEGWRPGAGAAMVGPGGALYVAGGRTITSSPWHWTRWIRKYSPGGETRWTREEGDDRDVSDMAFLPGGGIAGVGCYVWRDPVTTPPTISGTVVLGRFSPEGALRHEELQDDVAFPSLCGEGLAVDDDGSVSVAATGVGTPGGVALVVLKYDP